MGQTRKKIQGAGKVSDNPMASCALLSAGGGTGDTDAPSQVDVEPITDSGNESSFREIVRLK